MKVIKYQLGATESGEDIPIFKEPPPEDTPPPIVKLNEPQSAPPIVPETPSGGLVPLALLAGAWFLL